LLAAIEAERERGAVRVDKRAIERHVRERLADGRGLLTENVWPMGTSYCVGR
jgi:hypothetical protein